MTARRILGITLLAIGGVVLVVVVVVAYLYYESVTHEPLAVAYVENCSACHGEHMEGTGLGTPLVGVEFVHGETVEEIGASIANGFPARGMPGWADILPETEIRKLAIYISERRSDLGRDFRVGMALEIPEGTVRSALHDFRIETFAEGLDPLPYSISPLPDGRFLVTSSYWCDLRRLCNDPGATPKQLRSEAVKHSALKSLAGFLTTGGGTLFIGVDDAGAVVGLRPDLEVLSPDRRNTDQLINNIRTDVAHRFRDGDNVNDYVAIAAVNVAGSSLLQLDVASRHRLSFLATPSGDHELFRRQGNRTTTVKVYDVEEFQAWRSQHIL